MQLYLLLLLLLLLLMLLLMLLLLLFLLSLLLLFSLLHQQILAGNEMKDGRRRIGCGRILRQLDNVPKDLPGR